LTLTDTEERGEEYNGMYRAKHLRLVAVFPGLPVTNLKPDISVSVVMISHFVTSQHAGSFPGTNKCSATLRYLSDERPIEPT
jgi:hypothetical protein